MRVMRSRSGIGLLQKRKSRSNAKIGMLRSMHIEKSSDTYMSKYFQKSKTSMEARKLYKNIKAKRVLLFLG